MTLSHVGTLRAETSPLSVTLALGYPDAPARHLLSNQAVLLGVLCSHCELLKTEKREQTAAPHPLTTQGTPWLKLASLLEDDTPHEDRQDHSLSCPQDPQFINGPHLSLVFNVL